MVLYVLWVVPGLRGPGSDETARRLWEGAEDERPGDPKPLTADQVRGAAEVLKKAHPGLVNDPSAFEEGEPGVGLAWSAQGSNLDAEVDESGVRVQVLGHGTPEKNEADLSRALAICRTAADHLEGALFDPQLERIVDGDRDKEAILAAARQAWASRSPAGASGGVLVWLPLAGFVLVAVFARKQGPVGFLVVPAAFFVALFAANWIKRRRAARPSPDQRPIEP